MNPRPHPPAGRRAAGFPWPAVVITAGVTSLFWIFLLVLTIGANIYSGCLSWANQPSPFYVSVEHPERVDKGETFEPALTVESATGEPETLNSIDLYSSFLDGFEIVRVEPRQNSHDRLFDEFESFYFPPMEVAPDGAETVTFTLRAQRPGTFSGHADVCNPTENYSSAPLEIRVLSGELPDL